MERSGATMLQLIQLYIKRPYLCDKVAACNWTIAAHATLSRDFVAHSCDKIARENCRCDIGLRLTVGLLLLLLSLVSSRLFCVIYISLLMLLCLDMLQHPVLSVSDFNWQSVLRFRMEINTVLHAQPESAGNIITSDSSMKQCCNPLSDSVVLFGIVRGILPTLTKHKAIHDTCT